MIQISGLFNFITEADDAVVDERIEALMDALLVSAVIDPTVGGSMRDRTLGIEFVVDTEDAMEAQETAVRTIREAFTAAGWDRQPSTRTKLFVHETLLARSSITAEPVPA